ncbi:MAG: MFS transporter [Chloroflexi bacterium]|nr:MAG: MFS transporter [Chloroflexota bacterium]
MFSVLRTNRDVRRLFIADNISIMGDYFTYVALAGLVKDSTNSNLMVALVYVAFTLPSFFISPIGGAVVDKFDRKQVLVIVSLMQALCAVGLLFITASTIWLGLLAQVCITALSAFINPAVSAALPNVVRNAEELRHANALFGASWGAMVFLGAAFGGYFSQTFGRTATFAVDIATFVIAAGLIALIKTPMQEQTAAPARTPVRPWHDMLEAFHFAQSDHAIFALTASKATFAVGAGAVSQLAILAADAFQSGDGGHGLLLAARGLGAALGPLLVTRLVRNNFSRLLTICGISGFAFSLCYLGVSVAPTLGVACLCIMVAHFGGGAQWTLSTLGLQMRSPDHLRGRVLAADMALATLMMGLSSIASGVLGEFFPVRIAIAIMGGTAVVAASVFMLTTHSLRQSLRSELTQT